MVVSFSGRGGDSGTGRLMDRFDGSGLWTKRLARGQYASGFSAGSDLGTHSGHSERGASGPVQGNHHGLALPVRWLQELAQMLQNGADHEQRIAFEVYVIVRDVKPMQLSGI